MATKEVAFGVLILLASLLTISLFGQIVSAEVEWSQDFVYFDIIGENQTNNQTNETGSLYVEIVSPEASEKCGKSVWLEVKSNATAHGGVVWYEYDDENKIYNGKVKLYFGYGWHTIKVYANDSSGNVVSDSVKFKVKKDNDNKDDDDEEDEKTYDDPIYAQNNTAKINYNRGVIYLEDFDSGEEATPWYIVLFNSGVVLLFMLVLVFITLVLISVYWYRY
jgi:hypothetical protein